MAENISSLVLAGRFEPEASKQQWVGNLIKADESYCIVRAEFHLKVYAPAIAGVKKS